MVHFPEIRILPQLSLTTPKKDDLSDCNNNRGISLINAGLKLFLKLSLN